MESFSVDNMVTFVFSIILLFIGSYLLPILIQYKYKTKKKGQWLESLRVNETINKCISDFERRKSDNPSLRTSIKEFVLITLALVSSNLMYRGISGLVQDSWTTTVFHFLIVNIILLSSIYSKIKKIYSIKSESKKIYLENTEKALKNSSNLLVFIFSMNYVALASFIDNYKQIQLDLNIQLNLVFLMFIISIFVFIANIYLHYFIKKYFSITLGSLINDLFSNQFPYVEIITSESKMNGKIKDIFDDNFIFIDNAESISIIEWDKIQVMTLKKNT
jgi:hypothetical protein